MVWCVYGVSLVYRSRKKTFVFTQTPSLRFILVAFFYGNGSVSDWRNAIVPILYVVFLIA